MLEMQYTTDYLKKEGVNSEVIDPVKEEQIAEQAWKRRPILKRLKRSDTLKESQDVIREPISIFQELIQEENQPKKQNLEGLLSKLRASYSNDLKIGAALKTGDCFFDAIAQGLNELKDKGLITNSERFKVKSLREDCADYANQYNNQDNLVYKAVIQDASAGGYFVPLEGPYGPIENPRTKMNQINEESTFNKYLAEIKNIAIENGPIPIWGRPEIEGRMISSKYDVVLYFYSVNEENGHKITVTKITPGIDELEVFIEGESLYQLQIDIDRDKKVVKIVNYKQHFVPLLSSLAADITEAVKVSSEEVYGLGDRNSRPSLTKDIGNYDLKEGVIQQSQVQVRSNQDSLQEKNHPPPSYIYNRLTQVTFDNDDSGNSHEWAGIDQINSYVNQAIGDNDFAYYIGPNNFSFDSEEGIKDIAQHICKKVGESSNHFYSDRGLLNKPFIVVSNTQTVLAQNPTDVNKQGGSHWISWVLLPKKYISSSGKEVNNSKYQVLFFDSLGKRTFPEQLKTFLIEGGKFTEETDIGKRTIELLPFCRKEEIDFKDNKDLTGQQMNGSDCGWWAVYYALMTVHTGGVEFLEPLKERKLSAKPLRSMMNLEESYQFPKPQLKKAKIGSELDGSIDQQGLVEQPSFGLDYDDQATSEEELINIERSSDTEVERLRRMRELFGREPKLDINFQWGDNKDTLLHIAVRKGELKIIEFCIGRGANIDIRNGNNRTPLNIAEDLDIPNKQESINILKQHIKSLSGSSGQRVLVEQQSFVSIPKLGSDDRSQPKPTETNRLVKWLGKKGEYTEEQIRENSNLLFLFGDNDNAKYRTDKSNPGGSGQASATRPTGKQPFDRLPEHGGLNGNAIGITTTFYDGYTPNLDGFKALMDKEFAPIETWVKQGGYVVVPCNDLGKHNLCTGIAGLKNKIPDAIEYIKSKVDNLVELGKQKIQNPKSKSLNTLKQELHLTLLVERDLYNSKKDPKERLKNYLSSIQTLVHRPQLKRTGTELGESNLKKLRVEQGMKRPHSPESVRTKVPRGGSYAASGLKLSLHGTVYQLKLLMFFLKRAVDEDYNFRLATEMDAAEKLDDLVFEREKDNGEVAYRFLQAKHKQDESKKIFINDLLTEEDGEFSLQKYFTSYRKIKQKPEFSGQGKELEDFIICTNIDLDDVLQSSFEQVAGRDVFLDIEQPKSKRLKLKINEFSKKEDLITVLKGTSDLSRLAKMLATYTTTDESLDLRNELLRTYHVALAKKVFDLVERKENRKTVYCAKFRDNFLNNSSSELRDFRKAFFEAYLAISKTQMDESDFWENMGKIELTRSKGFGVVFKLDANPQLADPKKLAEAIAGLISEAGQGVVKVKREKSKEGIIKDNLEKLAGHILIKKGDEEKDKYYFSSAFFDDSKKLPGNLGVFRSELKAQLTGKNIKFDKDQHKFHITNFLTCEEEQAPVEYNLPKDYVTEDEIKDFFERFVFAVNQPNEVELGKIIKEKLGEEFNNIDAENVYSRLQEEMLNWMKEKGGRFITNKEGKEFFNRIKEEILGNFRFNVRNPVDSFAGRKKELKELHDLVREKELKELHDLVELGKNKPASQRISISGLGGVGKTELVRKYIAEHGKDYNNNVIWIDAETYESISRSFLDFAKSVLNSNIKRNDVGNIVKAVYYLFKSRKSLFIFDNAQKLRDEGQGEGIEKFLPNHLFQDGDNQPAVLITSRNQDWGNNIAVLKLGVLEEKEAIEFVKNALKIKDNSQDKKIEELVEVLQCFPLALQQAITYIKGKDDELRNVRQKFEVGDYLIVYQEKANELLNFSFPDNNENQYAKTTFTTWAVTIDLIKTKQYGEKALEILNIMSYCRPNSIDSELFGESEEIAAAIQLLKKYSMVDSYKEEENELNIHGLVQLVIRLNLKNKKDEEKVLGEALRLMKVFEDYNYYVTEEMLEHFMALWKYGSNYPELVKQYQNLPAFITRCLNYHARYKDALEFVDKALESPNVSDKKNLMYQKGRALSGQRDCSSVLDVFKGIENPSEEVSLSIASEYFNAEDYKLALQTVEGVIKSMKSGKRFTEQLSMDPNYRWAKLLKARIFFAQGMFKKALDVMYEKAKTEQEKHLKSLIKVYLGFDDPKDLIQVEDMEVGDFLVSCREVAEAFSYQGKFQEALKRFQDLMKESKKLLGDDHSDVMRIEHGIAVTLDRQGKYGEAYELFETLLEKEERVKRNNSPVGLVHIRKAQLGISIVLVHQGKYDEALIKIKQLEEQLKRMGLPEGDYENIRIQHIKGLIFGYQGRYDDAYKIFSHLTLFISDSFSVDGIDVHREMAMLRLKQGKYVNIYTIFENVKKKEESFGPNHLASLFTKYGIAMLYLLYIGDPELALKEFKEVRKKREEVLGIDHPDTLVARCGMAMALSHRKEYDDALKEFKEVIEKREKVLGIDHPDTLVARYEMAMTLYHKKEYSNALKEFKEVIEKREKILGLFHPDTLDTKCRIAMVLKEQGDYNGALRQLRGTAEGIKNHLGNENKHYGNHDFLSIDHEIAMVLKEQGNYDEALRQLQGTAEGIKKYFDGQALKQLRDMVKEIKKHLGNENEHDVNRDFLSIDHEIAMVLEKQENYDEALRKLRGKLKRIKERFDGSELKQLQYAAKEIKTHLGNENKHYGNHDFLSIDHEIAMVLKEQGNYDEALRQLQGTAKRRRKYLNYIEDYLDDPNLLFNEYEVAVLLLSTGTPDLASQKFEEVLNEMLIIVKKRPLSVREREKLSELPNNLETLEQKGYNVDTLKKLSKRVEQGDGRRRKELFGGSNCEKRKAKDKRDVSKMLCVDSRDEEDITKEEKERRIKELVSDEMIMKIKLREEILSRYEEIKRGATANKNDLLSNAGQSLNRIKMLLLMGPKNKVSTELLKEGYRNLVNDLGALIHDHKNHVHGDHLNTLESRVRSNQLFSVAHDLYYLLKSEGNIDKGQLYSDQIKNMIDSYDHVEGKNKLDAILSDMDIKGLFRDRDIKDFYKEAEAYDKEVITIHSTQVFADEAEVYVKVRDNDENYQKVVIGEIASIQNTENYILDEETSGIKLRINDDKEYTITEESEKGHTNHYLNTLDGYKIKVADVISSFTEEKKILSRLDRLELLVSKKGIEEISNAEINNEGYDSVIDKIKRSLLQKGVSEDTFNQLKDHLDSMGERVFAEYISDVEKKLEGHRIEFDHNKFDLAKGKGAKSGKFFSLLAIYDLFDSMSDVSTLGRHDSGAFKKIFGINGILDAMGDVRESLSASYIRSDGKVITKIPRDSAIGKVISKVPDHIRKTFVKIINNPVVQGITFATIAYQFGYSIDEIAKGNHHPLNYYWTASSGIKLASMTIKPISVGVSSLMKGVGATILRGLSATGKVLGKALPVNMVVDFGVIIGVELHERMEYTKLIAGQVPLLTGNEQAEVFFAKVTKFVLGRDIEKEYENIIKVKGYLNFVKETAIKLLENRADLAGVVLYVSSITETYGEEVKTYDKKGSGRSPMARPDCHVRKVPYNFSFSAGDGDYSVNKWQHMISHTLSMSEPLERFLCRFGGPECLQELDKKKVYIVSTDAKHLPHLNKHEYEELGLRIASAPLKMKADFKHEDKPYLCDPHRVYRIHTNVFTFSNEPFVFINSTRDSPSGIMLYTPGPKRLIACTNYPAEIHVPGGCSVYYVGSANNSTTFVISHFTNGRLVGAIGKENAVVMNVKDKNIVVNLDDGNIFNRNHDELPDCSSGIQLYGIYNYISGSGSKHDVTTHCKTRLVDAKNAKVRQGNKTCQDQDYEVRVVNENNVHSRGLKKTIFIVGENTGSAEIKGGSLVGIKNNTDIIHINGTDVTQLKIIENAGNNYILELLDNNTQSIVSSVKVDNFEKLVIRAEKAGITGIIAVQNKSLFYIIKDIEHQKLNHLGAYVDREILKNSKKRSKAVVHINDTRHVNISAYEVARGVIDNNNLGIPISLLQVEKVMDNVAHEAIVENIYHNEIVADFSHGNIGCKKVITVELEHHGGNCVVKFPQACEPDNPVDLTLRVITLPYASASDRMVDLTECGISPEDIEVKGDTNGIILNSHINQGSFQVVLDNYLQGLEYQHIAFQFNKGGEIYKVNGTSLQLEPVLYNYEKKKWVDYGAFKYYEPGEQGLQIYHNQPNNENKVGFIALKDRSISDFVMKIVDGDLILSSGNNTVVKVKNWSTYRPARKMIFAYDAMVASARCTASLACHPEGIIEKFKKEKEKKEKPVQRKRRHQPRHHSREQRYLHGEEDLESRGTSRSIENDNYVIRNNKATSGASKPSSWINNLFGWVKDSVVGLLDSRVALSRTQSLPKESTSNSKPKVTMSRADLSQVDVDGTILLLDTFIRKFTGQKHISSNTRDITEQEALGYALNITTEFERVLKGTAKRSGVSVNKSSFDFLEIYEAITGKMISGELSKIPTILYSAIEEAYPKNEKFLSILKGNIEKMLDGQQVVNNVHSSNQMQNTICVNDKMPLSSLNSIAIEPLNGKKGVTCAGQVA